MISAVPNPNRQPPPDPPITRQTFYDGRTAPVSKPPSNSGRFTVIGMLAFGFLIVGGLWIYWDSYTRPFRPLQQAIAAAYPTAQAYVVGGRIKSHLATSPNTLRIVLQLAATDLNPETDEKASLTRAIELFHLAQKHQDLRPYTEMEIFLVQSEPERPARQWSLKLPMNEWLELTIPKSDGNSATSAEPTTAN